MTFTISPLYILFGIEAIILIIIFAVVMAIKKSKYKKLYDKLLKSQSLSNIGTDYKTTNEQIQKPSHTENIREIRPTEQQDTKPEPEIEISKGQQKQESLDISMEEVKNSDIEEAKPEEDPFSIEPIKNKGLEKLKKVVDFQKDKIVNLMCYKDILESAQKKLMNIHNDYQDLEQRFNAIQGDIGENKEYEVALEMFGENTKELKDFIDALQSENDALLEKFNTWEGQLKDMWAESDDIIAQSSGADVEALMAEKNEMMEKIKEFEEKIKEKTKQLEDAQAQYEDLENEYMTLYRQQQESQSK